MLPTRRRYLVGSATFVSAVGLGATALAQEGEPALAFVEIDVEGEYIVIQNVSDEPLDLSGYAVNFEVGQEVDQIRDIPEGTVLDSGATLTIAAGAEDVPGADVDLGYEGEVINNEESDVIGVLILSDVTIRIVESLSRLVSSDRVPERERIGTELRPTV